MVGRNTTFKKMPPIYVAIILMLKCNILNMSSFFFRLFIHSSCLGSGSLDDEDWRDKEDSDVDASPCGGTSLLHPGHVGRSLVFHETQDEEINSRDILRISNLVYTSIQCN